METQLMDNELKDSTLKGSRLKAADFVREREAHRIDTQSTPVQSSLRYLNTTHIHAYVDDIQEPLPPARPCHDSTLIAFAQLGLLRLRAQRAFVSLLDRTYCYTVAEATASSTLGPPLAHQETQHDLVLCGTATRHTFSLPSLILEAAIESLISAGNTNLLPLPLIVIPDLRQDDRFRSLPLVVANDSLRSCAGVPIKSYNGAFIGIFGVLDNQPRAALSSVDREFLCGISKIIMDQLHSNHLKREYDRSTRMVRGLGSFVENRATMSGLPDEVQDWPPQGERGREGALNSLQQELLQKTGVKNNPKSGTASHSVDPELSSTIIAKDWAYESTQSTIQTGSLAKPSSTSSVELWLSRDEPVMEGPLALGNEQSPGDDEAMPLRNQPTEATMSPPAPADNLQQLFSRAANIIRESIEVEGVLFFDASVGYWDGLLESGKRSGSSGGSSTTSTASIASSSGDEDALPTRSTIRTHAADTNCDVFGFSMTDGSSIDGKTASAGYLTVPERFLRILLRRYPTGKIFNFTADGTNVSETETDEDFAHTTRPAEEAPPRIHRKKYNSYSRTNEAALIINIFPKARSVLAFPLWDSHRERWFAGGVVWTQTPTRVFSIKGELSYLSAFGMVAMAAVARMDAQAANVSKTTLLSSISHELRSPLHGILGGVEILQSTEIDVFQNSVIHTVETCGVMLLDTIEHLLTQSNINQSIRAAKLQRRERRNHSALHNAEEQAASMKSTSCNVEIDVVVEEVVESIFAGHEFMYPSQLSRMSADEDAKPPSMAAGGVSSKRDASPSSVQNGVKVILDIQSSINWTFDIDAGALRRVVMNLFGNALKYTTAGYIKVRVSQRQLSKGKFPGLSDVTITIEDTGKGIGAEYLSNHLFKPFSQEDSLSQGNGLGLSITHQIVASLDGKIDVRSTVGKGTTMSVLLRLGLPPVAEDLPSNGMFLAQTRRTRSLRVSLLGFYEDRSATFVEQSQADIYWQLPRALLETLCRDWLHMDVLAASESSTRPDVYIATQAGAQELATISKTGTVVQPVIVICPSTATANNLTKSAKTNDKFGVFEYISQPCGPRKLAKTVTLCLDRWAAVQVEQAIQGPSLSPLAPPVPASTQSTFPIRTQSIPFTSPHFESSWNVSNSPPLASPVLLQEPEIQLSQPLKPLEPRHSHSAAGISLTKAIAPFLIVDDNDVNLKLLSTYLARKSYPFTTAIDGVLAVEAYKAARGNFSCIFMDIQMPRMDGIAATRKIREYERDEKLKATTVVALTGLVTKEKQMEAEASGFNTFFAKPVRLKSLDAILERTARVVG